MNKKAFMVEVKRLPDWNHSEKICTIPKISPQLYEVSSEEVGRIIEAKAVPSEEKVP